LNPVLSFVPPEFGVARRLHHRRKIALPLNVALRQLRAHPRLSKLRSRFPNLGWRLWMLARARAGGPGVWLATLADTGVNQLLICGAWEARPILAGTSHHTLKRLFKGGNLRLEVLPELKHGLLVERERQLVADLTTEHFLSKFVSKDCSTPTNQPSDSVVAIESTR
jgi:hypothetical protein